MLSIAHALSLIVLGHFVLRNVWKREQRQGRLAADVLPLEQASASLLSGVALWVASSWLLALFNALTRAALLATTFGAMAAAVAWAIRQRRARTAAASWQIGGTEMAGVLVILVPLLLWAVYVSYRAWLMPPLPPDAHSYHLPKAVLMLKEHGFRWFLHPDFRVSAFPANYELLLADAMLLDGSDRITEFISVIMTGAFMLEAAALAQSFWGRGLHALTSAVLLAGTPVVLLHAGIHKNDMMACAFLLATFRWGARWAVRDERLPAILLATSASLALGTKFHAGFAAPGLVLLMALSVYNRRRLGGRACLSLATPLVAGLLIFPLTGAACYVTNLIHSGSFFGTSLGLAAKQAGGYGMWGNIWKFIYLIVNVPFSPLIDRVWVPWRGAWWWWEAYDLHQSHYGLLVSVLVIVSPICILRLRRVPQTPERRRERLLMAIGLLCTFLLVLPVDVPPGQEGWFNAFPRYVIFVVPLVLAWTVSPLMLLLEQARRSRPLIVVSCLIATAFTLQMVIVMRRDPYAPFYLTVHVAKQEKEFRLTLRRLHKAQYVVDPDAGPHDHIAADIDFEAATYMLYGQAWTRTVSFIPPGDGPPEIPADARWVVVDRGWRKMWGHPAFRTMADFFSLVNRGAPAPDDLRVYRALLRDRRFRLVFRFPLGQAVFERVSGVDRVGAASAADRSGCHPR